MSETPRKPPFSAFLAASVVIFVMTLSAADSIGFVPYYIDGSEPSPRRAALALNDLPELGEDVPAPIVQNTPAPQPVAAPAVSEKPSRLRIPAINLNLPVLNPTTRDIDELDATLKSGPARYVDSALLGEKGNVLIFGHSSHLPVVHNQMYKAFNKIPELKAGNSIMIEGDDTTYEYMVTSVKKVDANDGVIDLSKVGNKLTIVTCDTLTGKSARYVLEAEFVGSYAL